MQQLVKGGYKSRQGPRAQKTVNQNQIKKCR